MKTVVKCVAVIGLLLTTFGLFGAQIVGFFMFYGEEYVMLSANLMLQLFVYLEMLGVDMPNTQQIVVEKLKEIKELIKSKR